MQRWLGCAAGALLSVVALVHGLALPLAAQGETGDLSERAPRFLAALTPKPLAVDLDRTPVLQQRIALDLRGATLEDALKAIGDSSGLRLAYSRLEVPVDRPVRLRAEDITVAAALTEVLLGLGVDVVLSARGQAMLVKRRPEGVEVVGAIAGTVTDAATGQPVSVVDVRVVGSQIATSTDDSGRYVLREVPVGEQRVTARRIGYEAETQAVTVVDAGTVTLDFSLGAVATRLDELVTTVTGDQRRLEVGHTVASVNADSLMQIAPVMSMSDLLQGRAPGVLSLPGSANAGRAGQLRIRGLNSSLLANDPVVVVDGIRVEAGGGDRGSGSVNRPNGGYTGRLADLDPDEIESVEIVKGPSAATLYGTDAANGVIVITTKRGQAGRTRWTVNTEQGLLQQRLDDVPDAYYAFGRSTVDDTPQRCTLPQRAAGSCVVDSLTSFNAMTDPATRPFKDGRRQQYGLQVSGGTAGGATYFLSGDYEQETGTQYMPELDQAFIRTTQGPHGAGLAGAAQRLRAAQPASQPDGPVREARQYHAGHRLRLESDPDGRGFFPETTGVWGSERRLVLQCHAKLPPRLRAGAAGR